VDVIARLARLVLDSEVPLQRDAITAAVEELIPDAAPLAPPGAAVAVADALVGLGSLEPLLRQPDVSDVLVNGDGSVWVERRGVLERSAVRFDSPHEVVAAVERVIAPLGLRLDLASPAVDARLADGSRLHALIPPVAVDGPLLAVRRFTEAVRDLDELAGSGGIDPVGVEILREAVTRRRSILVSGGTGAGKTTLLNLLSKEIPAEDRVVTVEDAAELRLAGHVVRLETRPANTEGAGAVTMRDLVRHALRLRPDRIIVGEVRGAEALDMLQAMSTGHDGSMSTVHANSPRQALLRVETLAMTGEGGASAATVRRQLHAAFDLVVQVERRHRLRRVRAIATVAEGAVDELWAAP
jgi:pilus assembly protein CpaF